MKHIANSGGEPVIYAMISAIQDSAGLLSEVDGAVSCALLLRATADSIRQRLA